MSQGTGVDSQVRDGLKLFDRIQLGAKMATVAVALTYVSGYLTLASFLGRFRISADSDSFFRAKYLYVGFEYWFFLLILVVLGVVFMRAVDLFRESTSSEGKGIKLTGKNLEAANNELAVSEMGKDWRALRWAVVVSALLVTLSSNILLATPSAVLHVLPLEVVLLFHILLFQAVRYGITTPYWLQTGDPVYIWGTTFGKPIAEHLANFACFFSWGIAAVLLVHDMLGNQESVHKHLHQFRASEFYWFVASILIYLDLRAVCSLLLGYKLVGKVTREVIRKFGRWKRFVCLTFFGKFIPWRDLTSKRWWRIGPACFFSFLLLWAAFYSFENDGQGDPHWLYRACTLAVRWALLPMILLAVANLWLLSQKRAFRNERRREVMRSRQMLPRMPQDRLISDWQTWVLRVAPASALYLVSVLAFASLVYPHIPDEKAGGNHNNPSLWVHIEMMEQVPGGRCPKITGIDTSREYAVLEEDSNWVYVIDSSYVALAKNAADRPPETFALRRDCIAAMLTESTSDTEKKIVVPAKVTK